MSKIRVSATKLEDPDVTWLSLVPRAATRAPFKILKEDKGEAMIDLNLRRILKGHEDNKPVVVGYLIHKSDRVPHIETALKAAGVKLEHLLEDADSVIYKQDKDADPKAATHLAIKLDRDFAVIVKGVAAAALVADSSFEQILKDEGFVPGIRAATGALYACVAKAAAEGGTPKDMVAKVDEAVGEYLDFTRAMVTTLPQEVFKAHAAFVAAKADAGKGKTGQRLSDTEAVTKSDADLLKAGWTATEITALRDTAKKADDADKTKKAEAERVAAEDRKKADDAAAAAAAAGKGPDMKALGEMISTTVKSAVEGFAGQLKLTTEAVSAVQTGMGELTTKVEAATKAANEAKETATKVAKGVRGVALMDANDDNPEDTKVTQKADDELGPIDTAFGAGRTVRKRDRDLARLGGGRHSAAH